MVGWHIHSAPTGWVILAAINVKSIAKMRAANTNASVLPVLGIHSGVRRQFSSSIGDVQDG
jgi:hypothetical protein